MSLCVFPRASNLCWGTPNKWSLPIGIVCLYVIICSELVPKCSDRLDKGQSTEFWKGKTIGANIGPCQASKRDFRYKPKVVLEISWSLGRDLWDPTKSQRQCLRSCQASEIDSQFIPAVVSKVLWGLSPDLQELTRPWKCHGGDAEVMWHHDVKRTQLSTFFTSAEKNC